MTDAETRIMEEAMAEARLLKGVISRELCDKAVYPPDPSPVSVFMAGSPGAGKTESSQNLIKRLVHGHAVLRIDADELRSRFETYDGSNSHLFQAATSILADAVHDCALESRQNFVFDGTLSKIDKARKNIERSLKRNRLVQIIYVYQDPFQAWRFVKAREARDGRHIPREAFIEQYFLARENVNILKGEFGNRIKVDLIVKNIDGTNFAYHGNIDRVDRYIPELYSKEDLIQRLEP
ncbi:MAG: zeta toxin family protein [bacterium]|nr:zeta toxin family protein [bacterium]